MRDLILRAASTARRLLGDRRGAAAVFVAVAMPAMLGTVALGLEVGSWQVVRTELQRRADLAAYAAARLSQAGATAQVAATAGADVAALNGAAAGSRSWSAATNTLTASDVTVALVPGIRNTADTAFKVVATRAVPLHFGRLFTTASSTTVSATAWAEVMTSAGGGGQPCLVALGQSGPGITLSGLQSGATIGATGCTLRSNSGLTFNNTQYSTINAAGVYVAAGSITLGGCTSGAGAGTCDHTGSSNSSSGNTITDGTNVVNGSDVGTWTSGQPLYESQGQLTDPLANNAAIEADFAELNPGTGTAFSSAWNITTVSPSNGPFSSLTSNGNLTMSPGLYIVNGNVSFSNGSTVTGTGVTIIASGTISLGGGATVNLTAPSANTTTGGIPGVVIAGTSTSTLAVDNGVKPTLSGIVYYPNGQIALAGGVQASNQCLELIGYSLSVTNGSSLTTSNCTNLYGSNTAFTSLPATKVTALVQ